MVFFPNCKINIGLDILRRREDGFHDIETLMVPVSGLCDILEIVPSHNSGVEFTQTGLEIDATLEENLCVRAYNLMVQRHGIGGANIHLCKIIPSGAGLGGGSSDAAFTIKGLNKIFSLNLTIEKMESLASELGSDTAFFIRNVPQIARGRGELLTPYPIKLTGKILVIVKPDIHISTACAYSGITPMIPPATLTERLSTNIAGWKDEITNAFETTLFETHPQLAHIKQMLYDNGAEYASMSGSGSALYGIFDNSKSVPQNLVSEIKTMFGKVFVYQQLID